MEDAVAAGMVVVAAGLVGGVYGVCLAVVVLALVR